MNRELRESTLGGTHHLNLLKPMLMIYLQITECYIE